MRNRKLALLLALLIGLAACSRDPKVARQKYLDSGNKYFSNAKYKQASILYRRALQKDMRFGEAWYRLGLSELKLGRGVDALRAFQRAVELQPDNPDAATRLAEIYLAAYVSDPRKPKHILAEIEDLAQRLLTRNPRSFDGLRLRGYVALANRDVNAALSNFQAANQVKPMQPDLVLALVQSLSAAGRWEEAEKLGRQLIEAQKNYSPVYDLMYAEYLRRDRVADAERLLQLKAESNPKQPLFLLQLAAHYFGTKRRPEMESALERLISRRNDFANARLLVGDFYFRIREFDRAVEQYQAGIKESPKEQAQYKKRMVECLVLQARKPDAVKLVDELLKDDPKDPEALAMRASLRLQAGSKEEIQSAVNDLQSVVSRMPRNASLRFNLARAYLAKGEREQARIQLLEAIKQRPDFLLPRLTLAQLYLVKGDFPAAAQTAGEAITFHPTNEAARLLQTSALIGMREFNKAREALTALIARNPNLTDAQFQIGVIGIQETRYKDAEAAFRRLMQMSPGDPRGLLGVAEALLLQNQGAAAITLLQAELTRSSGRSDLHMALANAAVRSERFDLAATELRGLIDKNPKSSDLHMKLGMTLRRQGQNAAAIGNFEKARELAPTDPVPPLELAMALDAAGQGDKAQPLYDQVLKLDPDNAIAMNNLAYRLAESGSDLDQALTLATRAKQKLPNHPDVSDTLGWIYIKKNLSDNAISIFQDLIGKHPERSTFHYHLGMALFQKGDKPQARRALQTALQKKPPKEEEGKIRDLMAKIG